MFDDLVKQSLGKAIEREDPANYAQCMDWAFAYCDALDIPRDTIRHLHAYEVWILATDETRKYFDLIPNSPIGTPQKGDLVIFGTAVGVSGHICVASGSNNGTTTFQSTDQNWNGHSYIEYIWHDYGPQIGDRRGVLGWLRPKPQGGGNVTDTNKAVGFDRGISAAFKAGLIPSDDSQKATPDTLATAITALKADRDNNAGRATKWDQLCTKAGLSGASSQYSVDDLLKSFNAQATQDLKNQLTAYQLAVSQSKKLFENL